MDPLVIRWEDQHFIYSKSGVSVVDYAIRDQDLLHSIANFIVKEPSSLSDHSPIMTYGLT